MTKKEFRNGMDSIQVNGEKKEKVWSQICEKQLQQEDGSSVRKFPGMDRHGNKFSHGKAWAPLVAALLICMILIPGIVHADEIVNYFRGHLSQSPELASHVNRNVFQDEDQHVSMEVCELLSDGYATCMTVKYTALDRKGREWLFGEKLHDAPPAYREDHRHLTEVLGIVPIEEENEEEILSGGDFGTEEIKQEQTETSRVFSLEYNIDDIGSKRCLFTYPLVKESKQKALTIKNPLKTYTYALTGKCSSANYTPQYLRVSKIKFVVYGENHGVYQHTGPNYKMISEEDIDSAVLYFNNRSPFNLIENGRGYSWMGAVDPEDSGCNMDLRVLSGEFYGQEEWIPFEDSENWYEEENLEERIEHRLAIDPEDVQKIEINGDVYTLNRVE